MDDDTTKNQNEDIELTAEEKQSEAEALSEVKEEELKNKLAEEFGINPDDEPEFLDKLVAREKANREKLSNAIKQKIKYRDQITTKKSEKPKENLGKGKSQENNEGALTEERLMQLLEERDAKRELEKLDVSDDIRTEVKEIAKLKNISVGDALKLPYIQSRIKEEETEKRISAASPKRNGRGSNTVSSFDPSKPLDPENFNLNTPEGIKEWQDAKAARNKYLASHAEE